MVKANELRIGNYLFDQHNELHEVGPNTFQRFRYPTMGGDESTLKPIQLSEKWAVKLGLESINDGWYRLVIGENSITWNVYDKVIRFNGFHIAEHDYVHEFQNLVFAITLEELKLKEDASN